MKKYLYLLPILFVVVLTLFLVPLKKTPKNDALPTTSDLAPTNESSEQKVEQEETTSLANPASVYCEENGGELEIVTSGDGSQFGMCQFEDYACEEWVYMNGECTIEEDAKMIKDALIAKGLDLSQSKVVIHKHLGKYISGGVVPVDMLGGGGYVFTVKDDSGNIKIVADGNGAIMCTMLEDYPDFPTYLISECIDETGNPITR